MERGSSQSIETDFAEDELTQVYIKELAPLVPSVKHGRYLPAYIVYQDVKAIVDKIAEEHPDYKRRIFGEEVIFEAPPRYWDLSVITEYRIPIYQWDDPNVYSPRKRAELRAYFALKGMVDVIEEHYRAQREEKEKAKRDGSK